MSNVTEVSNELSTSEAIEATFELDVLDVMARIPNRLRDAYRNLSTLEAASAVLTDLTGWPSLILDRKGRRVSGSEAPLLDDSDITPPLPSSSSLYQDGWLCSVIPSNDGYVLCARTGDLGNDQIGLVILGEVAALTGFELRMEQSVDSDRVRLQSDLANDMLAGRDRPRVIAHAESIGYELDQPHRVALIADGRIGLSADHVRCSLRRAGVDGLVVPWGANIAVVLTDSVEERRILDAIDHVVPGGHPMMGVSSVKSEGHDLSVAVAEANIAQSFNRAAETSNHINFVDVGVFRLFASEASWKQLESFVRDSIGAVVDYDSIHGSDLVATLDAYLSRSGSLSHLCQDLAIHRSTLVYRLGRIRDLLDIDIDDSSRRLELLLAARAVAAFQVISGNFVRNGS